VKIATTPLDCEGKNPDVLLGSRTMLPVKIRAVELSGERAMGWLVQW